MGYYERDQNVSYQHKCHNQKMNPLVQIIITLYSACITNITKCLQRNCYPWFKLQQSCRPIWWGGGLRKM